MHVMRTESRLAYASRESFGMSIIPRNWSFNFDVTTCALPVSSPVLSLTAKPVSGRVC